MYCYSIYIVIPPQISAIFIAIFPQHSEIIIAIIVLTTIHIAIVLLQYC